MRCIQRHEGTQLKVSISQSNTNFVWLHRGNFSHHIEASTFFFACTNCSMGARSCREIAWATANLQWWENSFAQGNVTKSWTSWVWKNCQTRRHSSRPQSKLLSWFLMLSTQKLHRLLGPSNWNSIQYLTILHQVFPSLEISFLCCYWNVVTESTMQTLWSSPSRFMSTIMKHQ